MRNATFEINLQRLSCLLELHGMSRDDLLQRLNENRRKAIVEKAVFARSIKEALLKKIDRLFNKGLSFYTDPTPLSKSRGSSVFFRKRDFNCNLKFADYWRVNQLENEINNIGALVTLSDYKLERKVKRWKLSDDAKKAAYALRQSLNLNEGRGCVNDRSFLSFMIERLADSDILVLEFVEQHNFINKTMFEGLFLKPNNICIKRQQWRFKREIFTLAHELGHYLLDREEIDQNPLAPTNANDELREIENWCNTFAFYLIVGDETAAELPALFNLQQDIDNPEIKNISKNLHISRSAIYTHLRHNESIGQGLYKKLSEALEEEYARSKDLRKQQREERKKARKKIGGAQPKPIYSPLTKDIYRHAFFEGVIEETEVIGRFKPSGKQIENGFFDNFLYEEA